MTKFKENFIKKEYLKEEIEKFIIRDENCKINDLKLCFDKFVENNKRLIIVESITSILNKHKIKDTFAKFCQNTVLSQYRDEGIQNL